MGIPAHTAAAEPLRRRRRSTAADPLRKVTLRLHERLTAAIRRLVDAGEAASTDAFIEDAIVALFRERRRARVYAAYAAAANDSTYVAAMAELNEAFDVATSDGLRQETP
ncbi:MAG: hypothetical protein ACYC3F_15545 [Gemmatimonadaceae bacterium]